MKKYLFLIVGCLFFFMSCKKDTETLKMGFVEGKVYTQNGQKPLGGVLVFVDYEGEIYYTTTSKDGYFKLVAPAGTQVVHIQSGRGKVFRTQLTINIEEGKSVTIPGGMVKLTQAANLAYVKGMFDEIETIIIDSLGYSADELTIADLHDLNTLENYGAIFLNCGKLELLDSLHYATLAAYVSNGGSLYVSDWAVEYLIGDNNSTKTHRTNDMFESTKNCMPRTGGFVSDTELCTSKEGPSTIVTGATITYPPLAAYLNKNTIDVEYDLGGWEVIKQLSNHWVVLIQDNNLGYGPLAIMRTFNANNIALKRQLDQGWITICHIPPGNPNNPITITISVNAWPAHQAHGDYMGACVGTGGQILFTTFHNHPSGHTSSDIMNILQYFVMNI
ncbi:MAG: carboxypeptidase-like regulatory domain-containing protein [Bacteroidales bacterium]|nr:carboxypeptidase-like regulatory domain-containing protein [Bacteroidales bacterium]